MIRKNGQLEVTRKQFVLGGAALAATVMLTKLAGNHQSTETTYVAMHWYEVVQDVERPDVWHVNLFSGTVRGDLSRATLDERRTMTGKDANSIKRDLEFPWRIQELDGHQEQSF